MTENPIERLGQAVGLSKEDMKGLFAEVRENHLKLDACTRHQFPRPERPFDQHATCVHCGGWMPWERAMAYADGVKHAGQPFEVWLDT